MKTPEFILVNCLVKSSSGSVMLVGRSVAFPVARTRKGNLLFAACSHSITEHLDKGGKIQLIYSDGTEVPLDMRLVNHLIPPELDSDLSFFEVGLERQLKLVTFASHPPQIGSDISHVRNVSYREEFLGQKSEVTTQKYTSNLGMYIPGNRLFGENTFFRVDKKLTDLLGRTPKSSHRGMNIQSFPGVSGSPLWDKFGNVIGMVAGGNEELTDEYQEYFLVYMPAKQIRTYLKHFLGDVIA